MTEIESEFRRLEAIYDRIGHDLKRQPPATDEEVASIAATTGVDVDEGLIEFWKISNGSGFKMWFAEGEGDFTPYYFLSVSDVLDRWQMFAPYDAAVYEEWYDDEEWGKRDPRIQRHFLRHKLWVSFAEFNGGSHLLHFDADPTPDGTIGQIINYVHDPDGVSWKSDSFLEFFRRSNHTLEEWLDDPDALCEQLWIWD